MREERGQLTGDLVISEPYTLWGKIAGNLTVINGGKLYVRGTVFGDLTVEAGGRVHALGNIKGSVTILPRAKVIIGGIIGGDVLNRGGRLYVEHSANVMGKVKTREDGETKFEDGERD
jgi:cytoskeletal protein CcmA (bactofilin family)